MWKNLFMQDDVSNNVYFKQFFIKCSFVYIIIQIAKHTPEVLGHLSQQCIAQ
jgi:hypothetical protein